MLHPRRAAEDYASLHRYCKLRNTGPFYAPSTLASLMICKSTRPVMLQLVRPNSYKVVGLLAIEPQEVLKTVRTPRAKLGELDTQILDTVSMPTSRPTT